MALSTSVNWISNFIIAFITPPLFAVSGGGYYFLLLGFCLISGIFVCFVYRETAGKTLEELGSVFGDVEFVLQQQESQGRPPKTEDSQNSGITRMLLVAEPLDMVSHEGVGWTKTESTLFSSQAPFTEQGEISVKSFSPERTPSCADKSNEKESKSMEHLRNDMERSDSIEEIDLS